MAETVSLQERPRYSAALARALEIAGPRRPIRVIAVLQPDHDPAALRDALSAFEMLTGRRPAPGTLELEVRLSELDRLAEREDLFRYFDTPDRLYGKPLLDETSVAAVRLQASDPERALAALQAAGGKVAGRSGGGELLGTVPSARLVDLLLEDAIETIEITGALPSKRHDADR